MSQNFKNESKPTDQLDPDVRFLLANERTLLAWVRTALALLAGGIALLHFGEHSDYSSVVGIISIFIGAVMTMIGLVRYRAADKAIRSGKLPDAGQGPQLQVLTVVALAISLIIIEIYKII